MQGRVLKGMWQIKPIIFILINSAFIIKMWFYIFSKFRLKATP